MMFGFTRLVVALVGVCLALEAVLALSPSASIDNNCIEDDEDCREAAMHASAPKEDDHRRAKFRTEGNSEYWLEKGVQHVLQKINSHSKPSLGRAKNIIYFVGDGMSLTTLAAARIYIGGEEQSLSFEGFPYTGLARTYALDRLVPNSAAAATALFCGVKTKYGIIGLDGSVERASCQAAPKKSKLNSIANWALDNSKWAGFVTTTRVTDATPAALYAHINDRTWENDVSLREKCGANAGTDDIALQLITGSIGKRLKVVMGGGRAQFADKQHLPVGLRADGRDLISEFSAVDGNRFVDSKTDWAACNLTEDGRLLGLFANDHLPYHANLTLAPDPAVPSLTEMTEKAIEILSKNPAGYFLMVEAGKIDLAHHETKAKLALDETAELSKAVTRALALTNEQDTLIVVTSDHGHTLSLAGYAYRSSDVLGISNGNADDNLPYKVLSYANGPGYSRFRDVKAQKRVDPRRKQDPNNGGFDVFPATVPLPTATHGGEDVPVYARGPWAHLFSGVYDQSTIPHLMAFAACSDRDIKACSLTAATHAAA